MNSKSYFAEEAEAAYRLHGHECLVCDKPATQLAHGIPQRKECLARYGWRIIHSRHNRFPACCTQCNAELQINAASDIETENIAKAIMASILKEEEANNDT